MTFMYIFRARLVTFNWRIISETARNNTRVALGTFGQVDGDKVVEFAVRKRPQGWVAEVVFGPGLPGSVQGDAPVTVGDEYVYEATYDRNTLTYGARLQDVGTGAWADIMSGTVPPGWPADAMDELTLELLDGGTIDDVTFEVTGYSVIQ